MQTKEPVTLKAFIKKRFNTEENFPFPVQIVTYPKGKHLLRKGDIEKNIFFIRKGIVETTAIKPPNKKVIISFAFANQFVCSLYSIITKTPTLYNIVCLTECELEMISLNDFNKAVKNGSKLADNIMRYMVEWYYLFRLKKQTDLLTLDAVTRYNNLIKEEPEIVKHISVTKIAKYLGIHPKSLSRIRGIK